MLSWRAIDKIPLRGALGLSLLLAIAAGCARGETPDDVEVIDQEPEPNPEPAPDPAPDPEPVDEPPICADADEDGASFGPGCPGDLLDCDDGDPRRAPGQPELCDGIDNDCDGATDNQVAAPACRLNLGVCAGAVQTCKGELGFVPCGPDDYPLTFAEVEDGATTQAHCDGLDNDCDGQTDEGCPCQGDDVILCGLAEGECERGLQRCVEGRWGPCEEATEPSAEICDGLDNDCDGDFDEDLAPPPCAAQIGVCAGSQRRCLGLEGWSRCAEDEYGPAWASDEDPALVSTACDGLDNDCDGQTDEGCACLDGALLPCGSDVGACARGTQTCQRGRFGDCRGAVEAAEEVCDGLDNDCDGQTDEDLAPPPCELQQGVCQGARAICGGDLGWLDCAGEESYGDRYRSPESPQADPTVCEGLDNDCDGQTDEGCDCVDGQSQPCGSNVGQCRRGTQRCVGGRFGACVGQTTPADEVCDGLDNDCDGQIDEEIAAPSCLLTQGVCAGALKTCQGVAGFGACDQDEYGPAWQVEEATCDRRDNDCDGQTDEGCDCVDGEIQRCGSDVGACEAGAQTCAQGRWGSCQGEVVPEVEVCDGFDNDCDGQTDEALEAPACALGQGVCAGAAQACGGRQGWLPCGDAQYGPDYDGSVEVACDGRDNDCDGLIDEQCDCLPQDIQVCGSDVGACEQGAQRCVEGAFGSCEGEIAAAAEVCDGADHDCDGAKDEGLERPCARQLGVCAGAQVGCNNGAFPVCGADQYGPRFAAEESGLNCDGLDNDCDGLVDEACPPPQIVISELLYDEVGSDTGRTLFVELTGPSLTPLGGLRLEAVNGNGGQITHAIDLPNALIPFNGVFLIAERAGSQTLRDIAAFLVDDLDLQNGPDSLRLVWNPGTSMERVIDAIGYGNFGVGDVFAGEGDSATGAPAGQSLARDEAGRDTNNNRADFARSSARGLGVPTPGGAPLPKVHLRLLWDSDEADLDLHLLRSGAEFGGEGDCHWLNRNPDWGVAGSSLDDPRLDRDDFDGLGPEITNISLPALDTYLVQVHVYGALSPTLALVTLYVDGGGTPGTNEFLATLELPATDTHWAVFEVVVTEAGVSVVPRGETALVPFDGP